MYSKEIKQEDNKHEVVDLATPFNVAAAAEKKYVCENCHDVLVDYPQAKCYNPHAGPSYRCPTCNRIYDSSLQKLPKASKKVQSSLGRQQSGDTGFIMSVPEDANKGLGPMEDDYDKYDPEGDYDERMRMQGWHIVESRIELTDSQGRNRTLVRRNSNREY